MAKSALNSKTKVSTKDDVYRYHHTIISRPGAEGNIHIINTLDFDFYFELDSWAGKLWTLIDGRRNMHQIIEVLCKESGADARVIEKESMKTLRLLINNKLIEKISTGR